MKKITLGLVALTITFASMAQYNDNNRGGRQQQRYGNNEYNNETAYMDRLNLTESQRAQVGRSMKTLAGNSRTCGTSAT
jgi:Spy/CpxP family protein refolding chaperone